MEELLKTCPRAKNSNFKNYTDEEIEIKNAKVKELAEQYPKMTEYYIDMLYDWLWGRSDSELKKMMDDHKALPESERLVKKEPIGHLDPIKVIKGGYDPDSELKGNYSRETAHLANLSLN